MTRLDKISQIAFDALEDIKARDIVVYNVKKMTAYFDNVIVATGDSNRHCRALAGNVQEKVKAAGGKIYGIEGEKTGEWLLVDIGAAVVHIMQPAIRQYYNLEELWAPSPKVVKAVKAVKTPKVTKESKSPKSPKSPKATQANKPTKAAATTKAAKVTKAKPASARKPAAKRAPVSKAAPRRRTKST